MQIEISALEQLGARPVARVFEAAVVAWAGAVLVLPLHLVGGDLKRMTDASPVPIGDVIDALDKPRPIPFDEAEGGLWPGPGSRFTEVCKLIDHADLPGGWWVSCSQSLSARVFMHDCGLRLALTCDLVDRRKT